jgi:hypothetical protein
MQYKSEIWNGIASFVIILIIMTQIFLPTSSSKVGYCIDVSVNGTVWKRCVSGEPLSFTSESAATGTGNYSKHLLVNEISGMSMKESVYAKKGRLIDKNTLSIDSEQPSVTIEESGSNNSSKYTARIEEYFPVYITNSAQTYYRGQGIYTRSNYVNNKDSIESNYEATSLTKSSTYRAIRTSSLVKVTVTPGYVELDDGVNYATAISLSSQADRYSEFKFKSDKECVYNEYKGLSSINLKAIKLHRFNLTELGDDWLECCPVGNFTDQILDEEGLYKTMQA